MTDEAAADGIDWRAGSLGVGTGRGWVAALAMGWSLAEDLAPEPEPSVSGRFVPLWRPSLPEARQRL